MNRKLLLLLVAVASLLSTNAQQLAFKKTYSTNGPSNQGSSIIEQPNGDLVVCGIRSVPVGTQYIAGIILFRINNSGDTLWTKEIGTSTDRELAYNMMQLPNGNLVITGSINLPPSGDPDALIVCTDISGNVIWQKRYGGTQNDVATDALYNGSHIIVCGRTESFGAGNADAWLLKLNLSGDTVWTKTYGGTEFDDAWSIQATDNHYYFTGGTYSFASGQFDDAWVVKTDTSGNEIWHKEYGLANRVDWAWEMCPVTNGGTVNGFVLTGVKNTEETQPGSAQGSLLFIKIDTAGNLVWDKSISAPGAQQWRREGYNVNQLANGGFVISGYKLEPTVQSQQLYIVTTDASGNVVSDTAFGTSDSSYTVNGMAVATDGGWAVTGSVFTPGQQIRYIYVARFKPVNTTVSPLINSADVMIFPNPAGKEVTVRVPVNVQLEKVLLYSVNGKLCGTYNAITGNQVKLDIRQTGIFILEVYTDRGVVKSKLLAQ